MSELNIFLAKLDLKHVSLQIERTLQEIKETRPERVDYINSMSEAVNKLNVARKTFQQLEKDYLLLQKRNIDLEIISLKAIDQIKKMKDNATLQKL